MSLHRSHPRYFWVNAALAVMAFSYVGYRAAVLSITYDEAWTILDFVPNTIRGIFSCEPCDANNHLLHTLILKILFWFVNDRSEILARLPNVLSFLLYLHFAQRISSSLFSGWMKVLVFFLLIANPFLLDFFSLARGYGMSFALQLGSLHYFLSFSRHRSLKHAYLSVVLGALASLANLTQLTYLLTLIALIMLITFISDREKIGRVFLGVGAIAIILASILLIPIRKMLALDAFYYGGKNGIFQDTMMSLVDHGMYTAHDRGVVQMVLLIFVVLLIALAIAAIRRDRRVLSIPSLMLCMLIICLLSIEIQHQLFGTRYVIDRGALYLYPIIIILLASSVQEIPAGRFKKVIGISIVSCFVINLAMSVNFHKTDLWDFEAHTKGILTDLETIGRREDRFVTVDHSWPFRAATRYYASRGVFPHVQLLTKPGGDHSVDHNAQFYIHLGRPLSTAYYRPELQELDASRCDTIEAFPEEDVYLLTDLHFRSVKEITRSAR